MIIDTLIIVTLTAFAALIASDTSNCGGEWLYCRSSNKCIRGIYICDGNNDCGSGSLCEDETTCNRAMHYSDARATEMCESDEFYCNDFNTCIPKDVLCNGIIDCGDCSDENRCSPDTFVFYRRCSYNMFYCIHSGICIPDIEVCNGDNDCGDWDDEKRCARGAPTTTTITTTTKMTNSTTEISDCNGSECPEMCLNGSANCRDSISEFEDGIAEGQPKLKSGLYYWRWISGGLVTVVVFATIALFWFWRIKRKGLMLRKPVKNEEFECKTQDL